eukprot:TRINITY_DN6573_c0_g2_i1.p1 TRINITY_DN6573_c0_g2~~TRINITY_DN6573_c0_g2_i1.p1  ORF type:complete len:432 (+),score=68.90 TRINITY_DN6573_c0_g2_i1:197-1492(+)
MPSRRDQVWEMKRQRFFANRACNGDSGMGAGPPGAGGRRGPPQISTIGGSSQEPQEPNSPLSRLVQGGYPTPTGSPSPRGFGPGPVPGPTPGGGPGGPGGGSGGNMGNYSSALPPRVPGINRTGSSGNVTGGFDSSVAQQWSGNIQQTAAMHQQIQTQQSDPNYTGKYSKPSGYRVSHAPGGGSSISLSWNGGSGETDAASGRSAGGNAGAGMAGVFGGSGDAAYRSSSRGRARAPSPGISACGSGLGTGNRAPSPGMSACGSGLGTGNRAPSPGMSAYGNGAAAGNRAPSPGGAGRSAGGGSGAGMAGVFGGGGHRAPSPGCGGGLPPTHGGGARGQSPARHCGPGGGLPNGGGFGGGCGGGPPSSYGAISRQSENPPATGLSFGGRGGGGGSSNSYACGSNQNCGNYIGDRRITKIAQPPGGGSSVVFG